MSALTYVVRAEQTLGYGSCIVHAWFESLVQCTDMDCEWKMWTFLAGPALFDGDGETTTVPRSVSRSPDDAECRSG